MLVLRRTRRNQNFPARLRALFRINAEWYKSDASAPAVAAETESQPAEPGAESSEDPEASSQGDDTGGESETMDPDE